MGSEAPDDTQRHYPDDTRPSRIAPKFTVSEGGLAESPARAPAGVEAVRKAMDAAMRSGDWAHVKELASVMEQLWALKAGEVGK